MNRLISKIVRSTLTRDAAHAPAAPAPHPAVSTAAFEALEGRTLMSVAAPAALFEQGFAPVSYAGKQVVAKPGQWILNLSQTNAAGTNSLAGANAALGRLRPDVHATRQLGRSGAVLVEAPAGATYGELRRSLRHMPGFRSLEPNAALWSNRMPNDPQFSSLYGMHNTGQTGGRDDADIDAPEAWDISTGSSSLVVGVIDTGVDYNHPDLARNMWRNTGETAGNGVDDDRNGYVDDVFGYDFVNNDPDPMDDQGHGTHCAGTIAGAGGNSTGVTGVSWNSKIMALKFLSADGYGDIADAVEAVNYATMMKTRGVNIRLTSNSWGGGGFSQAMHDAIRNSGNAGMMFVAAAGNDGWDTDSIANYPSGYNLPNIISVAATDHMDGRAYFSNYGRTTVDLAAPGVDILSTVPRSGGALSDPSGYARLSGTSMATPHVSGVAALAWSVAPGASVQQVKDAIMGGVDAVASMAGASVTGGRLNAQRTLQRLNGTPVPTPPPPPPPVPSGDNDDQLSEATRINVGATSSAFTIASGTDVDMFRFTVTAGQKVGFDIDRSSGDLDSFIRLFDSTGRQLAYNDDTAAPGEAGGLESYLEYTFATAGTYYLGVSDFGNGAYNPVDGSGDDNSYPGTGTYTLALKDLSPQDRDDQISEAARANVGDNRSGAMDNSTDVDMVRVFLNAGQRVNIDLDRASGSTLDSYLRLFDASGRQVASNDNGNAPGETATSPRESYLSFLAPATGAYYVGVSGAPNRSYSPTNGGGDVAGSTGGYVLRLSGSGDADDQIGEARSVSVGSSRNDSIASGTDVDMVSFRASAGQRLAFDIDFAAGSTVDTAIRLFRVLPDGTWEELAFSDDDAAPGETSIYESYLEHRFETAGTYYLGVSSWRNAFYDAVTGSGDSATAGTTGAYTLRLSSLGTSTAPSGGAAGIAGRVFSDAKPIPETRIIADALLNNTAERDLI